MSAKTKMPLKVKIAVFAGLAVAILILVVLAGTQLARGPATPATAGPLDADREVIAKIVLAGCRKKQRNSNAARVYDCACFAVALPRHLSDADARVLATSVRQKTKPARDIRKTFVRASGLAGVKCALKKTTG
jgi:hypothetical protein